MNWYEKAFGRTYLEVYSHRNSREAERALPLILSTAGRNGPPENIRVLDLACGQGRYSRALAERGFTVAGVDLSGELLEQAVKLGGGAENPSYVRADMRRLPFGEVFDLVINMFTSFGYFGSDRENRRVLEQIRAALRSGGQYIIDYLNRDRVLDTLVSEDTVEAGGLTIHQERRISDNGLRVEKTVRITGPQGDERWTESVRMYGRQEMEEMLHGCGLSIRQVMGDYDGGQFSADSPRMILTGERID